MSEFRDSVASLHGQFSVVNRAVVVHAGEDDLGRGGNEDSLKTGNAGEVGPSDESTIETGVK